VVSGGKEWETNRKTFESLGGGNFRKGKCVLPVVRFAMQRSGGSIPLCSTNYFQPFTANGDGGCFGHVANAWTIFLKFNCTVRAPWANRFGSNDIKR
jgi:hypothetical protein